VRERERVVHPGTNDLTDHHPCTARQALEEHSARQLRIMFLLQPWDKPMNYSDQVTALYNGAL
jgi:hypothetical protein